MMTYYVIDSFGRSYDEGQTYETREDALAAARRIPEQDRPHGVWIAPEDDAGEEVLPAIAE